MPKGNIIDQNNKTDSSSESEAKNTFTLDLSEDKFFQEIASNLEDAVYEDGNTTATSTKHDSSSNEPDDGEELHIISLDDNNDESDENNQSHSTSFLGFILSSVRSWFVRPQNDTDEKTEESPIQQSGHTEDSHTEDSLAVQEGAENPLDLSTIFSGKTNTPVGPNRSIESKPLVFHSFSFTQPKQKSIWARLKDRLFPPSKSLMTLVDEFCQAAYLGNIEKSDEAILDLAVFVSSNEAYANFDKETVRSITIMGKKCAAQNGHVDFLKNFEQSEQNINDLNTLLKEAVEKGDITLSKTLLAAGAKINADLGNGQSALHVATHPAMIDFLVHEKGAQVDATDNDGNTALHLAAQAGDTKRIKQLVQLTKRSVLRQKVHIEKIGANVNSVNKNGETPLHVAATAQNNIACKELRTLGANVLAVNKKDENILHLAVKAQNINLIIAILRQNVDKINHTKGYNEAKKVYDEIQTLLNDIDTEDLSPLARAISQHDDALAAYLFDKNKEYAVSDNFLDKPVELAIKDKNYSLLKMMVKKILRSDKDYIRQAPTKLAERLERYAPGLSDVLSLFVAAANGQTKAIVSLILKRKPHLSDDKKNNLWTYSTMLAQEFGQIKTVDDINFYLACSSGDTQSIQTYIEKHVSLNTSKSYWENAVTIAKHYGHADIAGLICEKTIIKLDGEFHRQASAAEEKALDLAKTEKDEVSSSVNPANLKGSDKIMHFHFDELKKVMLKNMKADRDAHRSQYEAMREEVVNLSKSIAIKA